MTTDTPSEAGLVERMEFAAVLVAPMGSKSGDGRWTAAETLREAVARITALEAESAALRDMLREARAYVARDGFKRGATALIARIDALTKDQSNG